MGWDANRGGRFWMATALSRLAMTDNVWVAVNPFVMASIAKPSRTRALRPVSPRRLTTGNRHGEDQRDAAIQNSPGGLGQVVSAVGRGPGWPVLDGHVGYRRLAMTDNVWVAVNPFVMARRDDEAIQTGLVL